MNDIRLKDATRILKKNNFTLGYIRGDHYNYFDTGGTRLVLVFHMNRSNSCPGAIWKKTCKQHNIKY